MVQIQNVTFGFIERMSRAFVGFILLILSFTIALAFGTDWFATLNIMAMYPLLTALIAWDPVYVVIELIKDRFADFMLFHR